MTRNTSEMDDAGFNSLPSPEVQGLSPALLELHKVMTFKTGKVLDGRGDVLQSTQFTNGVLVPAEVGGKGYIRIWIPKIGNARGDGHDVRGIYSVDNIQLSQEDGKGWVLRVKGDGGEALILGEKTAA